MPVFREIQRFTQPWIMLVVGFGALSIWVFTLLMFTGRQASVSPADRIITIVIFISTGIFLPVLFAVCRMTTTVTAEGITVLFFPFHRQERLFKFKDMRSAFIRKYSPIVEYGGWGLRRGPSGRAYNVSGNQGLQLEMADGQKILIGTQQPQELFQAVKKAKSHG